MGANLGFFAEDRERDFPELNKCPDCETFFADTNCPICGKECPEEFRAGNRKPVKQKKHRRPSGNGRVQFVPWYHSVLFIVAMLIIQPIIGLILTWTGVWKTHWKVIVTLLIILPYVVFAGLGIIAAIVDSYKEDVIPINSEMSDADYHAACTSPDVELLYRNSNNQLGDYVCINLTVVEFSSTYYYTGDMDYKNANVYLCHINKGERILEFFVIDYRQEGQGRLAIGDKITVWGEVAGEIEAETSVARPAVYARFIDIE